MVKSLLPHLAEITNFGSIQFAIRDCRYTLSYSISNVYLKKITNIGSKLIRLQKIFMFNQ